MIVSILLSFILIALGLIHFNWAIGGQFGFAESLPTKESGESVLHPKKIGQCTSWNWTNSIWDFLYF